MASLTATGMREARVPRSLQTLQLLHCQPPPGSGQSIEAPETELEEEVEPGCCGCCPGERRAAKKKDVWSVSLADTQALGDESQSCCNLQLLRPGPADVEGAPVALRECPEGPVNPLLRNFQGPPPVPQTWLRANLPELLYRAVSAGKTRSVAAYSPGARVTAYWHDDCPGVILLAMVLAGGNDAPHSVPQPQWRWQALYMGYNMDSVTTHSDAQEPHEKERVVTVLIHRNPTCGQLALAVTGSRGHSCLMVLTENMELLWHHHWESVEGGCLCSIAWIWGTDCVAAVDNAGQLRVFHENGEDVMLELPEGVLKEGMSQRPSLVLRCDDLLGSERTYVANSPQLQNRQPRHQAAFQLCSPAGSSYNALTSSKLSHPGNAACGLAPTSTPQIHLPPHTRDALLVIWNGLRIMALSFEVSAPVRPSIETNRVVVPEQISLGKQLPYVLHGNPLAEMAHPSISGPTGASVSGASGSGNYSPSSAAGLRKRAPSETSFQ